jgi:hypothetical protein
MKKYFLLASVIGVLLTQNACNNKIHKNKDLEVHYIDETCDIKNQINKKNINFLSYLAQGRVIDVGVIDESLTLGNYCIVKFNIEKVFIDKKSIMQVNKESIITSKIMYGDAKNHAEAQKKCRKDFQINEIFLIEGSPVIRSKRFNLEFFMNCTLTEKSRKSNNIYKILNEGGYGKNLYL